jgi:type VI secretion system secreted protein Hcp
MGSIDTHIKFAGVEGESTHKDHKGEIAILSWTWAVTNEGGGTGGGSGKGRATPGDFTFTHLFDKSSLVLAKYCASGRHFSEVVVTARKAGDGQRPFLVLKFKEVFIKAVEPSGSAGGDIGEAVTFSYAQVDMGYKAQDDKGGLTGEVKFGWNIKTTDVT